MTETSTQVTLPNIPGLREAIARFEQEHRGWAANTDRYSQGRAADCARMIANLSELSERDAKAVGRIELMRNGRGELDVKIVRREPPKRASAPQRTAVPGEDFDPEEVLRNIKHHGTEFDEQLGAGRTEELNDWVAKTLSGMFRRFGIRASTRPAVYSQKVERQFLGTIAHVFRQSTFIATLHKHLDSRLTQVEHRLNSHAVGGRKRIIRDATGTAVGIEDWQGDVPAGANPSLEERIAALEARESMSFAGPFEQDRTYRKNDVVQRHGLWICTADVTTTEPPGDHWRLIARSK